MLHNRWFTHMRWKWCYTWVWVGRHWHHFPPESVEVKRDEYEVGGEG